ncbi:hypothetical protein AZ20_0560 [Bordetella bronchiseptica E014]|nr:hypothetical protein L576_0613 [Bordetella bronchiseptica OSU054]KAK77604.1 hypothetical protein L507_0575 [Bordetella bronchiseptica CA90 BB02]KCV24640.1 hypothetical protein L489_0663 [Bordetella bronchiseptica 00-P-2730]KCV45575.1 hypothetical protein L572_0679 [Bordetella bronchiseptica 345]KDB76877.1 hypothetical protein L494_0599 [Bordetella bronchiseptica CA90 BB1334]KDC16547.1 hypothetical protein AZ20_0560 [Bordetella bronchiseptica E014]KDC22487.1 hypothetical protein L542_0669 [
MLRPAPAWIKRFAMIVPKDGIGLATPAWADPGDVPASLCQGTEQSADSG